MSDEPIVPERGTTGRVSKPLAWGLLGAILIPAVVAAGFALTGGGDGPVGEPGRLAERAREWRAEDGARPELVDVTDVAGFGGWRHTGEAQTSGGAAIADVDGDGTADVVVGGGSGGVFFGEGAGRWRYVEIVGPAAMVTSVAVDDVDDDGKPDIVFGVEAEQDVVVWGGDWASQRAPERADRSELPSGGPTTGVVVADVDGDGRRDLVRLGYGPRSEPAADVVWVQSSPRSFDDVELPDSQRRSLAVEVTDVDDDGDSEIWITRDIGWAAGGDSVYDRDPSTGDWTDRAAELGVDLEVDGMGVTVADVTGDGRLDAYVSDLGDNELLEALPDGGFGPTRDVGVARIRPPGAPRGSISSSWASAAVDVNLDGRLDVVVANGGFGPDTDIVNKVEGTTVVYDDPPAVLLGRADGTFADVWADLRLSWSGAARGMSAGDLDGDGDSDLVFVIHGEGLRVLRNDTGGPTLRVRPDPACDAAGATVTVTSELGTTTALLAPHTFLGAHAAEHIAGTSGPARVTVRYGSVTVIREVAGSGGRTEVVVPCRE